MCMCFYSAIGCADLEAPTNSHIKIDDGKAIITCDAQNVVQTMTCVDNEWAGSLEECQPVNTGKIIIIYFSNMQKKIII